MQPEGQNTSTANQVTDSAVDSSANMALGSQVTYWVHSQDSQGSQALLELTSAGSLRLTTLGEQPTEVFNVSSDSIQKFFVPNKFLAENKYAPDLVFLINKERYFIDIAKSNQAINLAEEDGVYPLISDEQELWVKKIHEFHNEEGIFIDSLYVSPLDLMTESVLFITGDKQQIPATIQLIGVNEILSTRNSDTQQIIFNVTFDQIQEINLVHQTINGKRCADFEFKTESASYVVRFEETEDGVQAALGNIGVTSIDPWVQQLNVWGGIKILYSNKMSKGLKRFLIISTIVTILVCIGFAIISGAVMHQY